MKKITFTLLFYAFAYFSYSQNINLPFSENFSEMQIPNNWQAVGSWNSSTESGRFTSSNNGFIMSQINYSFNGGEIKELYTPYIDVSNVSHSVKFAFEQKYTMLFANFCNVLLTKNGGQTWDTIHKNLYSTDDHLIVHDITSNLTGADSIQLRFSFGFVGYPPASMSDYLKWEFDDIIIYEVFNQDLAITSINTPNSGCQGGDTVNVTVTNYGSYFINTDVVLSYSLDNGSTWTNQNKFISLASSEIINFTFDAPAQLNNTISNITTKVQLNGDESNSNDTMSKNIIILNSISTFPHTEDFENNDGGWFPDNSNNGTWQYGHPNSSELTGGSSSSVNAWSTNLTGLCGDFEDSYLYSPCYDFTTLNQPVVEFDIWYQSNGQLYSNFNSMLFEYSIDNGQTWTVLGNNYEGGINWYDYQQGWFGINTLWKHASHDMALLSHESKVNFRYKFKSFSQPSQKGFAIDNFCIHEAYLNDIAVSSINNPVSSCDLSNVSVNITVSNLGISDINSFSIEYSIDGINWVSESVSQFIPTGENVSISFTQNITLSNPSINFLNARALMSNDQNLSNNLLSKEILFLPTLDGSEIIEDFENTSANYWISEKAWNSTSNDWELSLPTTSNLNSAYSGSKSWVTNANGNYTGGQISYVYSPCMNLSEIVNPAVEFYLNCKLTQADLDLQYSTDGLAWFSIGSTYSNFWYQYPFSSFTMDTEGYEVKKRTLVGIPAIESNLENIRFRFKFTSTNNYTNEGVAFDNFRVYRDDELATTVNIAEAIKSDFKIYPNPTNGMVYIEGLKDVNNMQIQILDLCGNVVLISDMNTSIKQINIEKLPIGVYMLRIDNFNYKLMVE
jgi:hypothetical protein